LSRAAVVRAERGLEMVDVVELRDARGAMVGQGLWDPSSPIAARVYAVTASPALGPELIVATIERAFARRNVLADDASTTAYRLCHGEGDRVPGVVIDR